MVMYKIDRRGGVQKSYTRTDPGHVVAVPNPLVSVLGRPSLS